MSCSVKQRIWFAVLSAQKENKKSYQQRNTPPTKALPLEIMLRKAFSVRKNKN